MNEPSYNTYKYYTKKQRKPHIYLRQYHQLIALGFRHKFSIFIIHDFSHMLIYYFFLCKGSGFYRKYKTQKNPLFRTGFSTF